MKNNIEGRAEKEKAKQIWVIEDNADTFRLLERAVFNNYPQIEIRYFADGESALSAIDSASPDIILIDGDLGEKHINGSQIVAALRERGISAKLYGFSNSGDSNEEMVRKGADGFVEKDPVFTIKNVRNFLDKALNNL